MEKLGANSDEDKDETPSTLPPSTPSPSSLVKQKKKKKLKDMMHVTNCVQSSKKIKKAKSIKVVSEPTRKSTRTKLANNSSSSRATIRAQEVQSSLDPKFPSFVKEMARSHVSSCFWMGLPGPYCKSHLPKKDIMVAVEDESGKECQMQYFYERTGLGGGWRSFAISHKLVEGDVLIFQLVEPHEPTKFKVHIIRANDVNENDGALKLEANSQENDAEREYPENGQKAVSKQATKRKRSKSLQYDAIEKKETTPKKSVTKKSPLAKKMENNDEEPTLENQFPKRAKLSKSLRGDVQKDKEIYCRKSVPKTLQEVKKTKASDEEPDLEIISGPISSSSQIQFKDVKNFEDFTIIVEDICIDSELSDDIRLQYYNLCLAKKAFLHARLMQGLNSKLIAGIITETVHISDSIRKISLTTCRGKYANWERALKSFHFLGMSVGFILVRIKKLVALAFESEDAVESRKYIEAKVERARAEEEMATLKLKFDELKETYEKCGDDLKTLKSKAEEYQNKFQQEVDAPW